MHILLDTRVFVWWLMEEPRLKKCVLDRIGDANSVVYISAISIWEILIKSNLGKIKMPTRGLEEQIRNNGFSALPISVSHALAAGALPMHHRDPFDRMLIAQAQVERLTLITSDTRIKQYKVSVLNA